MFAVSVYTDEYHDAHIKRLAPTHIAQSLPHSKSLTSESQFSDTDKSFPYWQQEAKRVTPQMYLDANKENNGGKENTGPTCYHARIHPHTHSLFFWSLRTSSSLTLTILNTVTRTHFPFPFFVKVMMHVTRV